MKNHTSIVQTLSVGFVVTCLTLSSCAADVQTAIDLPASETWKEIAPSELKIVPTRPETSVPKQKESGQPPVDPARAESRTPQERAEARAADPKDSSGVGIIKIPVTGTGSKP